MPDPLLSRAGRFLRQHGAGATLRRGIREAAGRAACWARTPFRWLRRTRHRVPIRILLLTSREHYDHKMARSDHFQQMRAVGKHPDADLRVWGTGHRGYQDLLSLEENLRRRARRDGWYPDVIHYYRPGEHLEAQGDPPRTPLHVLVYNEAFDQESRRAEEWQGRGRLGQHMVQVTGQESDEDLVRLVSDWVGRTLEAAERASRLQQIALRIHTMHYYAHVYLLRVREALAARASLEAPAAAGTTQGNDLPQRRTVVSTRTGPRAR